jgi:hypothetical protein
MFRMTKDDAAQLVRSLAPGSPDQAVEWGVELMLTVSSACGGHEDVDLGRAWVKALEVSSKPYAAILLAAMSQVPPQARAPSGRLGDGRTAGLSGEEGSGEIRALLPF